MYRTALGPNPIKPDLSGIDHESVEEYLSRGGQVNRLPPWHGYIEQYLLSKLQWVDDGNFHSTGRILPNRRGE